MLLTHGHETQYKLLEKNLQVVPLFTVTIIIKLQMSTLWLLDSGQQEKYTFTEFSYNNLIFTSHHFKVHTSHKAHTNTQVLLRFSCEPEYFNTVAITVLNWIKSHISRILVALLCNVLWSSSQVDTNSLTTPQQHRVHSVTCEPYIYHLRNYGKKQWNIMKY